MPRPQGALAGAGGWAPGAARVQDRVFGLFTNVRFHVTFLDGVYVDRSANADIAAVIQQISRRVIRAGGEDERFSAHASSPTAARDVGHWTPVPASIRP